MTEYGLSLPEIPEPPGKFGSGNAEPERLELGAWLGVVVSAF